MVIYFARFSDLQQAKMQLLDKYSKLRKKRFELAKLPSGQPYILCDGKRYGYMSISHTQNILVMAFSRSKIGVDIENKNRSISQKLDMDIREWTRIEAYAKMTGKGLGRELINNKSDLLIARDIVTFDYEEFVVSISCKDRHIVKLN